MKTSTEGSRWIIHSAGGVLRRLPEGERWVAEDQVHAFRKYWEELSEFVKTKDPDYNFAQFIDDVIPFVLPNSAAGNNLRFDTEEQRDSVFYALTEDEAKGILLTLVPDLFQASYMKSDNRMLLGKRECLGALKDKQVLADRWIAPLHPVLCVKPKYEDPVVPWDLMPTEQKAQRMIENRGLNRLLS